MAEDDDDDGGTALEGKWVRKYGHISEHAIDARWVLYHPNDERPQGSLRIVSHPDLRPGHLKSYITLITSRRPKTEQELTQDVSDFGLSREEFEAYSIDEHITAWNNEVTGRMIELEALYGVKIFEK